MNFKTNIRFDFVGSRKKFFTFSIALVIIGILSLFTMKLNLGIDFSSGTTMDATTPNGGITQQEVKDVLNPLGYSETPTVGGTKEERISIRYGEELDLSLIHI